MRNHLTSFISLTRAAITVAVIAAGSAYAQSSSDPWTGFYVGGHAGFVNSRASANTSTIFDGLGYFNQESVTDVNRDGAQRLNNTAFNGGGQFGYNRQFGRIVIGGEVDFGSQRASRSEVVTGEYSCCAPDRYTLTQRVKTNWLFTARPRVGIAAGRALVYATGGLALTDVNYSVSFTDTFDAALETASFKKTRAGYTAGGGVEVRLAKRWSVKGEYLFSDFRRASTTSTDLRSASGLFPQNVFTHSTGLKTHNVRFGANYRF